MRNAYDTRNAVWYLSYVWHVKHNTLPFLDSIKYLVKLSNVQEEHKPIITSQNASYTGLAHFTRRQEMWANAHETRDSIGATTSEICVQRVIARFEGGTQIWRPRTEDFLNQGGRNLDC